MLNQVQTTDSNKPPFSLGIANNTFSSGPASSCHSTRLHHHLLSLIAHSFSCWTDCLLELEERRHLNRNPGKSRHICWQHPHVFGLIPDQHYQQRIYFVPEASEWEQHSLKGILVTVQFMGSYTCERTHTNNHTYTQKYADSYCLNHWISKMYAFFP